MLLILPTEDLFAEFSTCRTLLSSANICLQQLGEAIIDRWACVNGEWGAENNPFARPVHELVLQEVWIDWLQEPAVLQMNADDRKALYVVVGKFVRQFYHILTTMTDYYDLSAQDYGGLRLKSWLGDNPVLDIPKQLTGRELYAPHLSTPTSDVRDPRK